MVALNHLELSSPITDDSRALCVQESAKCGTMHMEPPFEDLAERFVRATGLNDVSPAE